MARNAALTYVRVSRLDEEERARKISPEQALLVLGGLGALFVRMVIGF